MLLTFPWKELSFVLSRWRDCH